MKNRLKAIIRASFVFLIPILIFAGPSVVPESASRGGGGCAMAQEYRLPVLAIEGRVRFAALEDLKSADDAAKGTLVPELIEALRDGDWRVRYNAAEALEAIGRAGRIAEPALAQIASDTQERMQVRESAVNALASIGVISPEIVPDSLRGVFSRALARSRAKSRAESRARSRASSPAPIEQQAANVDAEREGDEAQKQGNARKALDFYSKALHGLWFEGEADSRIREKLMKLVASMPSLPELPEEFNRHTARGQYMAKSAKDQAGYATAVTELEQSVQAAPWCATGYFNLGLVQEGAGQYEDAIRNLKLYLAGASDAPDSKAVQKKIYELEVKMEQSQQE